jgi:hypothetical protein
MRSSDMLSRIPNSYLDVGRPCVRRAAVRTFCTLCTFLQPLRLNIIKVSSTPKTLGLSPASLLTFCFLLFTSVSSAATWLHLFCLHVLLIQCGIGINCEVLRILIFVDNFQTLLVCISSIDRMIHE